MITDLLQLALRTIFHRKLRSWLTLLGIFIGIAAVVSLISISQGMEEAIAQQFLEAGSHRLRIGPAGEIAGPLSGSTTSAKITEEDVDVVKDVQGIDSVVVVSFGIAFGNSREDVHHFHVMGVSTDRGSLRAMEQISFFNLAEGRLFTPRDTYSVILGSQVVGDIFEGKIGIGDRFILEENEFTVIGIQENTGTGFNDIVVRIPRIAFKEVFGHDEISSLFALVKEGDFVSAVAEGVSKALRRHRDVKEGEEDFVVESPEESIEIFTLILDIIQMVLLGVAAISLFVGAIGIMNTMYTSVYERRKEIGIMKSLGARNSDILLLFLFESGWYGFVGGIIGILFGLGISYLVSVLANNALGVDLLSVYVSWWLVLGALCFSFFIGTLSGILPARQASELKPVETLRS